MTRVLNWLILACLGPSVCSCIPTRRDNVLIFASDKQWCGERSGPSVELRHAIEALKEGDETSSDVQILAWCMKSALIEEPPCVHEEVIVLVRWRVGASTTRWSLMMLCRDATSDTNRNWEAKQRYSAPWPWRHDYKNRPTLPAVAEFIRSTNFGNNECVRINIVICVVLYESQGGLLRELSRGISSKEKDARFNEILPKDWKPDVWPFGVGR
jgi:hypothetical protein